MSFLFLRFNIIFLTFILFSATHSAKMKLFANFDAKVDGHNAVLGEREKILDGVKARLVQESGNVLGGGGR